MTNESSPPVDGAGAGGAPGLDARSWARLRWRCRRGMLENDIILTRFLDAVDGGLDEQEVAALDRLLDLGDNELWDLLSGHKDSEDETLQNLVRQLRNA